MKKTKQLLVIAGLGIVLLAACNKKEDDKDTTPTTTKTKKDYLIEGKWQVTSKYEKFVSGTDVDEDTTREECVRDDFMMFLSSGKILNDEGSMKCDPSDPQTDSADTWEMSGDYTKVTVVEKDGSSSIEIPFTILELTATAMQVEYKFDTMEGGENSSIHLKYSFKNIK